MPRWSSPSGRNGSLLKRSPPTFRARSWPLKTTGSTNTRGSTGGPSPRSWITRGTPRSHGGVLTTGGRLWAALSYLRAHRGQIKGRSTLTQQLAKNLYFTPDRSFVRKLNEAVVAKRLEFFLSKERILEIYLNVVEWGPGIFGAEAAAQTYFDRDAGDLTLDHAAALAATLPHPLTSNPSFRPAQMAWRRALLLARLRSPPPPSLEVEVPVLPDSVVSGVDTLSEEMMELDHGKLVDDTLGVAGWADFEDNGGERSNRSGIPVRLSSSGGGSGLGGVGKPDEGEAFGLSLREGSIQGRTNNQE